MLKRKVKTIVYVCSHPFSCGSNRLHVHTRSFTATCAAGMNRYLSVFAGGSKVARAEGMEGAGLALAEACWFGLSNTFINDDESPLPFTANQRPLTAPQRWSPLAK